MKLYNGDCLEVLKKMEDNSVDSVVTDPPYGISFMGKKWDYDVPKVEVWSEVLRVLKPGGHALVACGTRTQHRMAVNLEDAGFEIRDIVAWVYGSGFPKSLNIGKAIDKIQGNERVEIGRTERGNAPSMLGKSDPNSPNYDGTTFGVGTTIHTKGSSPYEGWGTALKPAMELWTLCRKPLSEKTVAENVLKYGTGGINIDGCRVGHNEPVKQANRSGRKDAQVMSDDSCGFDNTKNTMASADPLGRFPANLIHDGSDEVVGLFPEKVEGKDNFKHSATSIFGSKSKDNTYNGNSKSSWGSASRFFKVCQLTTEDLCLDQSQISFVQYVESKLTGHEKLTVPESVAILVAQEDSPYQEELQVIQDFIGSYKRCTQHQNNVDVEKWENTDIIPIILNLLKLSGYVLNAIDKNINLENHKASGNNEPSRLLYCAKASKAERNTGLDGFTNGHPTIKPVKLMQYLCRLITPKDGIVLDPFMGSGSTGIGAKNERFNFIGIELDFEYFKIAQARIDSVEEQLF